MTALMILRSSAISLLQLILSIKEKHNNAQFLRVLICLNNGIVGECTVVKIFKVFWLLGCL